MVDHYLRVQIKKFSPRFILHWNLPPLFVPPFALPQPINSNCCHASSLFDFSATKHAFVVLTLHHIIRFPDTCVAWDDMSWSSHVLCMLLTFLLQSRQAMVFLYDCNILTETCNRILPLPDYISCCIGCWDKPHDFTIASRVHMEQKCSHHYLTRAVSSPTSDPGKAVLFVFVLCCLSLCPFVRLSGFVHPIP